MLRYVLRRMLYMIPTLIAVNLLTFSIFFIVNTPDDIARIHLGHKHVSSQAIASWKKHHGYDKPLFFNVDLPLGSAVTQTVFFQKSIKLMLFDFGFSDSGRDISYDVSQRMWPSLAIAVPSLVIGLCVNISLALLFVFFKSSYLNLLGSIVLIVLMSISGLFYIIGGQYWVAKVLLLVPISGYVPGAHIAKFIILPIAIGVISGIGSGVRWYKTLFLEEAGKDYVRTARSKGLKESIIYGRHILANALIPILTSVVTLLPLLFMGSLLTESFFGIPGLGSYTIDAIQEQDFAIVRSMVYLGAFLYMIGLVLTDISYTLVDPRIRFH